MKLRTIATVAAAGMGLAALVGCKKINDDKMCQPYYDKGHAAGLAECEKPEEQAQPHQVQPVAPSVQPEEQYPRIVRKELLDGYKLERKLGKYETDVRFVHNQISNKCTISGAFNFIYYDLCCDGDVNGIAVFDSVSYYKRGDAGTEALFAQADKDFANYKKELGVQ